MSGSLDRKNAIIAKQRLLDSRINMRDSMRNKKKVDCNIFSLGLMGSSLFFALLAPANAFAGPRFDGLTPEKKQVEEAKKADSESESRLVSPTAAQSPAQMITPASKPATVATNVSSQVTSVSAPASFESAAKDKSEKVAPKYIERGYRHEWMFKGDVDFLKVSTKSKPSESALNEQGLSMSAELLYGYFIGEFVEPVFELGYSQSKNKVGEFDGTSRKLSWGAGMLFNLPLMNEEKDARLHLAKWVPFGGLLVMSETTENDGKLASTSSSNNKNLMTNLVAGARYMAYPNVSINTSLRLSYEKSSTEAEADSKSGGERSKVRIQARLLGFSLLF